MVPAAISNGPPRALPSHDPCVDHRFRFSSFLLEPLALYLLSRTSVPTDLDMMKPVFAGWILWGVLGMVRMVAETPDILSLAWTNGRP